MNSISIRLKLPLIMAVLTVLAIAIMGITSFISARDSQKADGSARLAAIAEMKAENIAAFFDRIDRELGLIAAHPSTRNALVEFTAAFKNTDNAEAELQRVYITENPHPLGQKDKLIQAGTGTVYDAIHGRHHPQFSRLQVTSGYYDVFLFDAEGNLVYSVYKENDYATNMLTGQWRDTGLARVFRGAMAAAAGDVATFDDFAPYGPSYDAPASFIARAIHDASGTPIGVLAFQMPIDEINSAVRSLSGVGTTGDSYLVGSDKLMRTDSLQTETNDILVERADNAAISAALAGEHGLGVFGADEAQRLYATVPITFLGTTWALVVHQEMAELNAPVATLARSFALQGAVVFAGALLLSVLTGRSLSGPLLALGTAMRAVSERRYDTEVPATSRGDEIGTMARALEAFRSTLEGAEGIAREAAFKGAGFQVAGAPMLLTDTDLGIVYANSAMSRLLTDRTNDFRKVAPGFDGTTLLGREVDIFPFPNGAMRDRLAKGEPLPFREKIRIGDSYLGLLFDAVHDADGTHIGYVLEWRDQTFQMQAAVVLKALDTTQCRVEMTLGGEIKSVNDRFCSLLGTSEAALAGALGKEMLQPESSKGAAGSMWDDVAGGRSQLGIFRVRHDGVEKLLDGSLSPVPDERNRTAGFLLVGVDVTEQQAVKARAEAQRSAMEEDQRRVVTTLATALGRLAEGDVSTRIDTAFPEDYESLRLDFNSALAALESALVGVVKNAGGIRGEATEIRSATDDLSRRTVEQAASLEETAAAIEELTAAIKSAAASASEAADIATRARSDAENGGQVVERAVAAMGAIDNSSKEIARIVSVIEGIAFQTNLLALNAGVEAARAGDAGRGFAVVAAEVRALAQRCSEAAAEIATLVDSAAEQVRNGVSLVGETGTALGDIIRSAKSIAGHVSGIAASATEQSSGLAEINTAMSQLDRMTQQNAAMVEETTAASRLLDEEAKALAEIVNRFTVGSGAQTQDTSGRRSAAAA
jgi:methyl-accepting chemotaxis protein